MSKAKDVAARIQTGAVNPVQEFRKTLEGTMHGEVAKQLPKGVDPDRFIRTAITTVQMQPDLLDADRSSLFASILQAAKDGLLPDGREATIQVYNTKSGNQWIKKAQYLPMVGGMIKKMYASGCTKVDGFAVYEKDDFNYELGDEPRITHKPYWGSEDRGQVVAAYAIVKLENGEVKREVMGRGDIEKVREASKASNGPGWTTWIDQFAIKSVLKRVYKQVPGRSDEFESVAQADNEVLGITFDHHAPPTAEQEPAGNSSSQRLVGKVKAKAEEIEIVVETDVQEAVEVESVDMETGEILAGDNDPQKTNLDDIPGIKKGSDLPPKVEKKPVQSNEDFLAGLL